MFYRFRAYLLSASNFKRPFKVNLIVSMEFNWPHDIDYIERSMANGNVWFVRSWIENDNIKVDVTYILIQDFRGSSASHRFWTNVTLHRLFCDHFCCCSFPYESAVGPKSNGQNHVMFGSNAVNSIYFYGFRAAIEWILQMREQNEPINGTETETENNITFSSLVCLIGLHIAQTLFHFDFSQSSKFSPLLHSIVYIQEAFVRKYVVQVIWLGFLASSSSSNR